jgi:hypothetical protein
MCDGPAAVGQAASRGKQGCGFTAGKSYAWHWGCLFEEALQVDLFHNKGVSMERAVQTRIRPWIEKDSRTLDNAAAAGVVELDHDRVALKNKMAKACREGSWSTVTMPSCRPSDDATVPETGI